MFALLFKKILMTILYIIIPVAIILVSFFVYIFLWAVRSEQFDDLETPAHKMLIDDWNDKLIKQTTSDAGMTEELK